MDTKKDFDAGMLQLRGLFTKTIFIIPRNQRHYVWGKRNWQELFSDIIFSMSNEGRKHFIGSIVLLQDTNENEKGKNNKKDKGLNKYSVIDGQQRIITIIILFLTLMVVLKKENRLDVFNGLAEYVFTKDDFAQQYFILRGSNLILENVAEKIKDSFDDANNFNDFIDQCIVDVNDDAKFADAFKFFYTSIIDYLGSNKLNLEEFTEAILDIKLVKVTAPSEAGAYTIFEILNARGLELADHELLKNYIMFHYLPEDTIDQAKDIWKEIEHLLKSDNYMSNFIEHYATHRYGDKGELKVYQFIKSKIDKRETKKLLIDLRKKANFYDKLVNFKDGEGGNCSSKECRLFHIFKSNRYEIMRPVLLSLMQQLTEKNLSQKQYDEMLEFIFEYFVYYTIVSSAKSNRIASIIKVYAPKLSNGFSQEILEQFKADMIGKLPKQDDFNTRFKEIGFSNKAGTYNDNKFKKKVDIVLQAYENMCGGNIYNDATIEHIIPDNGEGATAQIGNLLLLEENLNKKAKDKPLQEKILIYKQSRFFQVQKFLERYVKDEKIENFDPQQRTNKLSEFFYKMINHN